MYQALQQINRLSAQGSDGRMARLQAFLKTAKVDMNDKYLQHCDPNIPIQKCSLLLGRLLLGKAEVFVRQQALRGLGLEETLAHATDETLALACDSLELCFEMKTDELLGSFQWLLSTFTEYHLLTYTLWRLCVRPDSPGADRSWTVVDKMFTLVEMQGATGAKWNVLRKLREKAAGIRRGLQGRAVDVADALLELSPCSTVPWPGTWAISCFRTGVRVPRVARLSLSCIAMPDPSYHSSNRRFRLVDQDPGFLVGGRSLIVVPSNARVRARWLLTVVVGETGQSSGGPHAAYARHRNPFRVGPSAVIKVDSCCTAQFCKAWVRPWVQGIGLQKGNVELLARCERDSYIHFATAQLGKLPSRLCSALACCIKA